MKFLTVQQYQGIKAALQVGTQDGRQIAKQFGVGESSVYKIQKCVKDGKFDELVERAERFHSKGKTGPHKKTKEAKRANKTHGREERDKRQAQIIHMRDEKHMTFTAIAEKLGITDVTANYYYNRRARKQQLSPRELDSLGKEQTNGNNPANRNILIGIAYAETERFISNLSERIAIPPEILRRRLAELLGHSPLR